MERFKKSLLWIWLLNKRLFFKIEFWVLLCIVPLLTIAFKQWVSDSNHSMFKIAVYAEERSDISDHIVDKLSESTVFQCITAESEKEADKLVRNGKVDAAWILPADLPERAKAVLASPAGILSPIITVIQREDDVFLQMAKMELYGLLYPDISYYVFSNYMVQEIAPMEGTAYTEEQLRALYDKEVLPGKLFRFSYIDASEKTEKPMDYLLSSLRPFLSLWLMMCGFVAAMYWLQDKERGTFGWVAERTRPYLAVVYQTILVLDFSLAMLLAIMSTGLGIGFLREIGLILLLVTEVVLFCNLLTYFCKNTVGYGTIAGLMMLLQLAIFPFFVRIRAVEILQWFFPTYYYFSSLHNPAFWKINFLYAGILLVLNLLAILVFGRRGRRPVQQKAIDG